MSNSQTILIIEDDPVFRRVLSFTVAKAGLAVETASNGQSGFDRLIQGGIDFLVTDYQMPVCSGLELLQRLEAHDGFQRPCTILCTAKGLELDSEQLQKQFDLVEIMHKPFSPRKLTELILKHICPASTLVGNQPDSLSSAVVEPLNNPNGLMTDHSPGVNSQ